MTRAELIQAVALRMDEITPSAGLSVTVDGSDGNPLYELINGLIDSGMLELFSIAPYFRLPQTLFTDTDIAFAVVGTERKIIDDSQAVGQRKIIRLKVPNDFLRVAEIDCTEFQRPISEVVPEQSAEGKRQHSPFLVAKEARPVGVMSHGVWGSGQSAVNCREIDCYSVAGNSTITKADVTASYIAKPASPVDSTTPGEAVAVEDVVPPVLIPALEWLVAARVFGARGDSNHVQICQQNAQELLV